MPKPLYILRMGDGPKFQEARHSSKASLDAQIASCKEFGTSYTVIDPVSRGVIEQWFYAPLPVNSKFKDSPTSRLAGPLRISSEPRPPHFTMEQRNELDSKIRKLALDTTVVAEPPPSRTMAQVLGSVPVVPASPERSAWSSPAIASAVSQPQVVADVAEVAFNAKLARAETKASRFVQEGSGLFQLHSHISSKLGRDSRVHISKGADGHSFGAITHMISQLESGKDGHVTEKQLPSLLMAAKEKKLHFTSAGPMSWRLGIFDDIPFKLKMLSPSQGSEHWQIFSEW